MRRFVWAIVVCIWPSLAYGQLSLLSQFNPGTGVLVSSGFDRTNDRVWIYASSGSLLQSYSRLGVAGPTVTRPGESANDFDISFATSSFTLGATPVPAGSLLAINGESGVADIYAVDPGTGAILASLTTAFGVSHVVGGAYHPGRGTFFLVQDRQPGGAQANLIAEVSPITGSVLNTFGTGDVNYTINFGDLEVHTGTGNLYLVTSDEGAIRELTPTGGFVQDLTLPGGVTLLSGIGFDEGRGEAWVTSTNGTVYQLGGFASVPEPSAILIACAGIAIGVVTVRGRVTKRKARIAVRTASSPGC
jgi:hypothetical protein